MKLTLKSINILAVLLFTCNFFYGQTINITDTDYAPLNCANFNDGGAVNFFDDGGGANYGANRRDTITICPDLPNGPKVSVAFGTNIGFTFDVHSSDTIYIFDGPNVNSTLLGTLNSSINVNGGSFSSTFNNNLSGCLTIVFHSDGANEGTGWGANVSCGNPPQPFIPHIEAFINGVGPNALNPIDTGYVDICFGDSVLIVAKPLFPNSFEVNGYGYSQNLNNVDFDWTFSNGFVAPFNDSIWFKPTVRGGFYCGLMLTDLFPQIQQMSCKIRVSQQPLFTGTGPITNPICVHEQGIILGGASSLDTVGVAFPPGTFELGGTVAGLTYLPDGSGQQYSTTITMAGFPPAATFSAASDLQNICLTMEHSFLGDLEVWLTCPNGTEVGLINSYSPGHLAGGFGGGGTFLGDADDNGNGTPGIGWEYCFSTVNATLGTMDAELTNSNTLPTTISSGDAMTDQGVYLPETSFAGFAGCPLNGNWTITVQDNQSIDDGYIFEWGLYFDASLFPNTESYLNYITEDHWNNDPTIISTLNDTSIVVFPDVAGNYDYTFVVTDDFGCIYDTTVQITVKPGIVLNMTSPICSTTLTSTLNTGTNDGVWTSFSSPANPTVAQNDVNTSFTFPSDGTYNLVYSDTSCTDKDTVVITIDTQLPTVSTSDYTSCEGSTIVAIATSNIGSQFLSWSNGVIGTDAQFTQSGLYYVTAQNSCGIAKDSTLIQLLVCDLDMPNVFTPGNGDNLNANEIFRVLDPSAVFDSFHCQIFNRWGNLIYEYTDVFGGWDGKASNGKDANAGVYFYKVNAITFSGKEFNQHGFLELVR